MRYVRDYGCSLKRMHVPWVVSSPGPNESLASLVVILDMGILMLVRSCMLDVLYKIVRFFEDILLFEHVRYGLWVRYNKQGILCPQKSANEWIQTRHSTYTKQTVQSDDSSILLFDRCLEIPRISVKHLL